jgi:hypothetical protein
VYVLFSAVGFRLLSVLLVRSGDFFNNHSSSHKRKKKNRTQKGSVGSSVRRELNVPFLLLAWDFISRQNLVHIRTTNNKRSVAWLPSAALWHCGTLMIFLQFAGTPTDTDTCCNLTA